MPLRSRIFIGASNLADAMAVTVVFSNASKTVGCHVGFSPKPLYSLKLIG